MASALAAGLIRAGTLPPSAIFASDRDEGQLAKLRALGVTTFTDNTKVVKAASVIVLAVKPHVVPPVLQEIAPHLQSKHLIVSIAAGVTIKTIEGAVPAGTRVVRVMPNTPCLVGASASAFALGSHASKEDGENVLLIFSSVGKALPIEESKLDAVTGLSGSGPAYIFVLIEALADGGVRVGLPRDTALTLAAQTVLGSAKMVLESNSHVGQLKDSVASPGGTTIAGLHQLEIGAFRATLINAVKAATERATELSRLAEKMSPQKSDKPLSKL